MDALLVVIVIGSLVGWIMTKYSIWCLPLLLALSILAKDDYYPLSWYPMYSDPNESENYLYLATWDNDPAADHEPMKVRALTGLSAPKVKKMYKSWADDYAKNDLGKKDRRALSDEERDKVGRDLLDYFRDLAEKRNNTLPEKLVLMEVWIEYDEEKGYRETPGVIAVQPAAKSAN